MAGIFDQMISRYEIRTENDRLNAIHEVMHQVTLAGLYRAGFFEKAAFYGGTCLRIFYDLSRFSEDMDFSLLLKDPDFTLESYFDTIKQEFLAIGRDVVIEQKAKSIQSNIESAFLKDNTDIYNVTFRTERTIKIKIEVDKNPPLKFDTEFKLLLLPWSFRTRCVTLPGLYAGKIHALLFRNWKNRVKGRDWYDFEWYVRKGIIVDFEHLKERSLQSGYSGNNDFTIDICVEILKDRIRQTNIELVKADVRPFIKNTEELAIWSTDYFLELVDFIKFR
jgi:predicted nucleotidyltransferase component of viral defense system